MDAFLSRTFAKASLHPDDSLVSFCFRQAAIRPAPDWTPLHRLAISDLQAVLGLAPVLEPATAPWLAGTLAAGAAAGLAVGGLSAAHATPIDNVMDETNSRTFFMGWACPSGRIRINVRSVGAADATSVTNGFAALNFAAFNSD